MTCVIPGCRNSAGGDDMGVCGRCGIKIARRYRARLLDEHDIEQRRRHLAYTRATRERRDREQLPKPIADQYAAYEQPPGTSFVYYVRIGDHVKIGYTAHVLQRLRALRVPVEDLLALEPGDREWERLRHEQFAHLRITKRWENFRPAEDLELLISELATEYGRPKWLSAPRRGKNGPIEVRQRAR